MNKIILIGCLVQNPKVVASEGKRQLHISGLQLTENMDRKATKVQITSAV